MSPTVSRKPKVGPPPTTVSGLLSLLIDGPLFKGLATVTVFGLSIGTLYTLFVLPALFAIFVDFGMKVRADDNG